MKIRRFLLKFLVVFFISGLCYANEPEQREDPEFQCDNLDDAIGYTCVDVRSNVTLQTPNWIHYVNFRNKHAVIMHKTLTLVIVRMGDINVRAYLISGLIVDKKSQKWRVYPIDIRLDCLYTTIYKEMIEELRIVADECTAGEKDFI